MDEAVCAANVIRMVGSKYNPRYNHTKFLDEVIANLKKLDKLEKME